MTNFFKRGLVLSACALTAIVPTISPLAQSIPTDAGQTLRDIERRPSILPDRQVAPVISDEERATSAPADQSVQIPIGALRITGNTVFDTETLHALVAEYEGGTYTLADLDKAAARITAYYRERGYMVARAYVPAQRVENGIIDISVLEGHVDTVTLKNNSRLDDARVARYVEAQIGTGSILRSLPVDRSLLLLADTPGVGGAQATLRPGATVGTSELIVNLDPAKSYSGYIAADNHGNRYTGEYRLDGSIALNSPLGIGDQFTVRALFSDEDLAYGRVSYSLPVGYDGLRVGAAYASSWYGLGEEFSALDAKGRAEIISLYGTYPILRTLTGTVFTSLTLEDKRLKDRTGAPYSASDRDVQLATLGFSGNHYDRLLGGGITSFDLSLAGGRLGMDANSRAIDDTTARADGNFARVSYGINRLQYLTPSNNLYAAFSGQQASKNLNSSEKMSLGGANGVRAYPQGEGDGDEGWVGTIEMRHSFPDSQFVSGVQGAIFYDIGSVKINHTDYNADKNSRTISGAGLGLNAALPGDVHLGATVAWRISGGDPKSDSDDRVPRVWFQLSKKF